MKLYRSEPRVVNYIHPRRAVVGDLSSFIVKDAISGATFSQYDSSVGQAIYFYYRIKELCISSVDPNQQIWAWRDSWATVDFETFNNVIIRCGGSDAAPLPPRVSQYGEIISETGSEYNDYSKSFLPGSLFLYASIQRRITDCINSLSLRDYRALRNNKLFANILVSVEEANSGSDGYYRRAIYDRICECFYSGLIISVIPAEKRLNIMSRIHPDCVSFDVIEAFIHELCE